jgi:hypothetical protein|tara:strand:- start:19327 stop:19602 length:276 start_codon:yes stop_codon:yes gene_type:complete
LDEATVAHPELQKEEPFAHFCELHAKVVVQLSDPVFYYLQLYAKEHVNPHRLGIDDFYRYCQAVILALCGGIRMTLALAIKPIRYSVYRKK